MQMRNHCQGNNSSYQWSDYSVGMHIYTSFHLIFKTTTQGFDDLLFGNEKIGLEN